MIFPRESFSRATNSKELDIRITNDARFIDQKVTPDVLSYIADSILNLDPATQLTFTKDTIWDSEYFKHTVKDIFGKPDAKNSAAENEYDKFSAQPLKALAYCGILKESKGRKNYYTVLEKDLLEYIAQNPRNAVEFLDKYLQVVLEKSGFWDQFEIFFKSSCGDPDLQKLKTSYTQFTIQHTKINKPLEVSRIFTKVLNPLAFKRQKPGTNKGHASKHPILFSDLMYNQVNFRDLGKSKNLTRVEAQLAGQIPDKREQKYQDYLNQKAKKAVNRRHTPLSEVSGDLADGLATQVHHIFPVSQFPELVDVLENLVLLTPSQHYTLAHPENKTFMIDERYQKVCLLAKIASIRESLEKSDGFYDPLRFIYVINQGYGLKFGTTTTLDEIENYISNMQIK